MCILFVYILYVFKVAIHYVFSVLSMLVMFPKKFDRVGELYPGLFFGFLDFFNFAKPLMFEGFSK